MNIVNTIRQNISRLGLEDSIALIQGDRTTTYTELFSQVDRLSHTLATHPSFRSHRPRIGLFYHDGIDYIITALATLAAGACFVPIPAELTPSERESLIETTALSAILLPKKHAWSECHPEAITSDLFLLEHKSSPAFDEATFHSVNPAFIRFSSGTTGTAKGVVLSHEKLLERITAANSALEIGPSDTVLWILPMAHHFAVSIVLYLYHGATTVIETSREPKRIAHAARSTRTTVLYASPFHYAQLAQLPTDSLPPTLRLAVATAAGLPESVAESFLHTFGMPLTQGLGIIEIGLPILNTRHAADHPTALGSPLPAYKIRLEQEQLFISGPGMFDAYLSPWTPAEDVLEDGYFPTGDLAEWISPGLLKFLGRSKSVLNVAGMKVFPEEIEAVLNQLPGISLSRVYGLDHPTFGTVPVAALIHEESSEKPSAPSIKKACKEKLSAYKVPVQVQWVDSLPLTASGKVKRSAR